MPRHSVRFALLLAMLIGGTVSNSYGEQILKKNGRKTLGNRIENGNKFRSCRGKVLDVGDGQVEATNIKCGCSTCPPILGNRDKWDQLFKVTPAGAKPSKEPVRGLTDLHHQTGARASVLLRHPPTKEVTLGYVGKREGDKFRTCDGDVMEIQESDKFEEADITCDTDIRKLPRKILKDGFPPVQFLGVQISKRLFLTCDNSIFELAETSRLSDTDLDCDCDSCSDAQQKPPQKKKPGKPGSNQND